jgi:hypothetical protein
MPAEVTGYVIRKVMIFAVAGLLAGIIVAGVLVHFLP